MKDKILEVKKEIERITNIWRLTREEKYDLIVEKANRLSEKEMWILIEECKRDFESSNRLQIVKEYITIFLTGIGLLFTVYGIYMDEMQISQYSKLIFIVTLYIMILIVILLVTSRYRSSSMNKARYMIDILERLYKESHGKHL